MATSKTEGRPMKKILTHLANDWYKYLLELIVITAGIIGAFMLNSWNVDNKNRTRELQYLQNIRLDLQKDLELLHELRVFRNKKKEGAQRLIATINNNDITDLNQFIRDVNTMLYERKFKPNNTTFLELSSSGNLNIISEDSIKLLMLDLTNNYAYNNEAIAHETFDYREYVSKPTARYFDLEKHLPIILGRQKAEKLGVVREDFEQLLNNLEYKNGLYIMSAMSGYIIPVYIEIERKSQRIIELIDHELKEIK